MDCLSETKPREVTISRGTCGHCKKRFIIPRNVSNEGGKRSFSYGGVPRHTVDYKECRGIGSEALDIADEQKPLLPKET